MIKDLNLHGDIKDLIGRHFGFLKQFGFKPFEKEQIAHEYHFKSFNDYVNIDIWFEQIYSTPIMVTINGLYVEHIELHNKRIREYYYQLNKTYSETLEQYLKTDDKIQLAEIAKNYSMSGKLINDFYLKEISQMLNRNPELLEGNLNQLKINSEIIKKKNEESVLKKKSDDKIYTLEIDLWNNGEWSAAMEFKSIEDVKKYLKQNSDTANYRLLDFNNLEIEI